MAAFDDWRRRGIIPPPIRGTNRYDRFAWGLDHGHLRHNPIATFERAYRSDRAEMIWLPEHVAAFEAVASPEIRLAMKLALHTGQRQVDLLRLPWSA